MKWFVISDVTHLYVVERLVRTSGDTYCAVPTNEFLRDRRLSEGRDEASPSPPFAPSPSALPFALPSTASEKNTLRTFKHVALFM